MKKLPEGCTRVCRYVTDDLSGDDLDFEDTTLYRAPDGRYIAEGYGGPRTIWAREDGPNSWANGGGIMLVDSETANDIMERVGP